MTKKAYYLVLSLLFLAGLAGALGLRILQSRMAAPPPFSPQETGFTLTPPSESLTATLTSAVGSVEKQPRDKDEFEKASEGDRILQGESVATREKSTATIQFPDFAEIALDANSVLGFISLIPESFLLNQPSGSVTYEVLWEKPISVRSLHALLELQPGESQVSVVGREITVEVFSGKAKLALVDLENETNLFTLQEGQKAVINDAERSVVIKKL